MSIDQLNASGYLGDTFFDYDQATIRDDGRATLQKNTDWLRGHPTVRFTVEGHCDSRGSAEYNLGLGDRRASAVKQYLISLGIGADRIVSLSKGKEQPFCRQETESCWSQNRRGHFIITAK